MMFEVVKQFSPKSAVDLHELHDFVTNEQEDIDSASSGIKDIDSQRYKSLEKDYRALVAVEKVIHNNLKAFRSPDLLKTNIFIYDYDEEDGAVGAIHVELHPDSVAEIHWIGSYMVSGKKLLMAGLEAAKEHGYKKYKLTAKWNSEGFYRKMGLHQTGDTKSNPFANSNMTDFAGDISESAEQNR